MKLELKENDIVWMGRSASKPEGYMIPTHLKVSYRNQIKYFYKTINYLYINDFFRS